MQRVTFVVAACALLLLVPQSLGATGRSSCQSVAAVFYTSGDWWRLAQALGANPSPCAQYYVSIPPLAASKTTIRSNAAWQIRAIGPNFHALAEVNYSAWASWVTATGNSWYQAGQEARRRMAAAGYDVGAGDTWAVNEASSAVVAGTGQARQNLRQLLSGLFYGDGSVPQAKGFVFGVGVGQTTTPLPAYKAQLESWLQDDQFWGDMSTYAIAYYQEVYGDARAYAITGVNPQTRESYLLPYLTYLRQLATAGPQTAARSFLTSSYGALANAAWAYANSYGYTNVDPAVMADFVSAQVYALRQSGISYIGFAWDASNPGLSAGDFASQTSAVLARMAGAVHETDAGDPTQACEATGCASVLSGGAPATGWSDFATWTPTVATFTSAPQTLDAGAASQPISLQLQTGGIATTLPVATTVSVTSSSTGGTFANSPAGPWSPTLTLTLPPGTGAATFYAEDANGGTPTLTATTNGTAETQVETVNAPNPTVAPALAAAPPTAHIGAITLGGVGDRLHLSLNVVSAIGQPLQAHVRTSILTGAATFASSSATTTPAGTLALTVARKAGPGCYVAKVGTVQIQGYTWDGIVPNTRYCVPPSPTVTLRLGRVRARLALTVSVAAPSGNALTARVAFDIEQRRSTFASGTAIARDGALHVVLARKPRPGCYSAHILMVAAPGYAWNAARGYASLCF